MNSNVPPQSTSVKKAHYLDLTKAFSKHKHSGSNRRLSIWTHHSINFATTYNIASASQRYKQPLSPPPMFPLCRWGGGTDMSQSCIGPLLCLKGNANTFHCTQDTKLTLFGWAGPPSWGLWDAGRWKEELLSLKDVYLPWKLKGKGETNVGVRAVKSCLCTIFFFVFLLPAMRFRPPEFFVARRFRE